MSTPSSSTNSTGSTTTNSTNNTNKKRREHPLFTTNPAITLAQRIKPNPLSPLSPSAPPVIPSQPDALTDNGAATFSTTGSPCLDLFFSGMVRGCSPSVLHNFLSLSWSESPELTLQVLMQGRDCRGGKGERLVIVDSLVWLRRHKPCTYIANLLSFLRLGYFKDLLNLVEKAQAEEQPTLGDVEMVELEVMAEFLRFDAQQLSVIKHNKDSEEKEQTEKPLPISLAAKWAPTEGSHYDKPPLLLAHRLARLLYSSHPHPLVPYRKLLSSLRAHLNVVERLMCHDQWQLIQFENVPAKAHTILRSAFKRHQEERYKAYLEEVKGGKKEIKSTGLQPHELTKTYRVGGELDDTIEAQWRDLVEKLKGMGGLKGAVAVVDVSGSMTCGMSRVAPIDPAIALGLLVAEVNEGPFHGRVLTFDVQPKWHVLPPSSLHDQVTSLAHAPWGGTTNLQATFDLILTLAVHYSLPPTSLPSTLLIFSDMEFNSACSEAGETNFDVMKRKYEQAGYEVPRVVFWNLSGASGGRSPVRMDEKGVALLSGFSGELLKMVMMGVELRPYTIMKMAVDKYEVVVEDSER